MPTPAQLPLSNDDFRSLNQELAAAARHGSIRALESALGRGADPLALTSGETPLMAAAADNRLKCLARLLPLSDPKAANPQGHTALHLAAMSGHAQSVRALLPVSDPAQIDNSGLTAFMKAVCCDNLSCARVLAPHSDPLQADENGCTALILAAKMLNPRIIAPAMRPHSAALLDLVIEHAGSEGVAATDRNGQTAFVAALSHLNVFNAMALVPSMDLSGKDSSGKDPFVQAWEVFRTWQFFLTNAEEAARPLIEILAFDPRATEEQLFSLVSQFTPKDREIMHRVVARHEAMAMQSAIFAVEASVAQNDTDCAFLKKTASRRARSL